MFGRFCKILSLAMIALLPGAALSQIALPRVDRPSLPDTRGAIDGLARPSLNGIDLDRVDPAQLAKTLRMARLDRLTAIVRANRDRVEFDADRAPALRGVLLATGVTRAQRDRTVAAGYRVLDEETIPGIDLTFVRFAVPDDTALRSAQKQLRKLMPDAEISADNLYFASGDVADGAPIALPLAMQAATAPRPRIGLIDSGVGNLPARAGRVLQKGFARGGPHAADHGTAVAALVLGSAGTDVQLLVADVYGQDTAGGNASAIARALGWLVQQQVSVINISLVGPDNALVHAAIRQAQVKGAVIVAAVGNDGPASPPAYPAAQFGVIGVTGVDGAGRVLPEAGRGAHVAFAAPGRNTVAVGAGSRTRQVRGTSFAAPLVAGRLARLYPSPQTARIEPAVRALIAEARDVGRRGRDPVYGHGLVCPDCGR